MPLKLPRLPPAFKIINKDGSATGDFILWWQSVAQSIERSVGAIELALEAAGIALDAAEAAQASADAAAASAAMAQTTTSASVAEQSIVNSGVVEEIGVLQAGASGSVTVPNHKRRYGNTTLNPTVNVAGGTIPTSFVTDDLVYVYYDDPSRAGGTVTYQATLDPNVTVQSGSRHAVGSVNIPDTGSQNGSLVRPPGVT